jgi:hypothetical protein
MNNGTEPTAFVKLALLGAPGAGKSTFVAIAMKWAADNGFDCAPITLARPLYQAQAAIYNICGSPLDDEDRQDGELLNFLGSHMRKINPAVLKDHFNAELKRIELRSANDCRTLIICTDARPIDVDYLLIEEFRTILITVSPDESKRRRACRGDISLGATDHVTELGLQAGEVDTLIGNNGSVVEYAHAIGSLLDVLST